MMKIKKGIDKTIAKNKKIIAIKKKPKSFQLPSDVDDWSKCCIKTMIEKSDKTKLMNPKTFVVFCIKITSLIICIYSIIQSIYLRILKYALSSFGKA
jgi:hypothetical protein